MKELISYSIGRKIKELRLNKGLTLKNVSEQAGLSIGFLSGIEKGADLPSIPSLSRILEALGTNIARFFVEKDNEKGIVGREEDKLCLEYKDTERQVYLLTPEHSARRMEIVKIILNPGGISSLKPENHQGEETGIVLEGNTIIDIGGDTYELKAGDNYYINSKIPHFIRNIGDGDAVILCVNTPPVN